MKLRITFSVILAVTYLWGAHSQEANTRIAKMKLEIEKVKKEMATEEKEWAEEKAREVEGEKRRREHYDSFNQEKQGVQSGIQQIEDQIQQRMDQLEKLKMKTENLERQVQFLRTVVLDEVRDYQQLVQNGFPYRQEKRMETVQLLLDDLIKEKVSPEEGFNRLWVSYESEHNAASDAEVFSGQMNLPEGKTIAVKYLRVGKQVLAYITPAGDKMGVLVPKDSNQYDWVREDQLNFDLRSTVRHALAVAEGKAIPGFVAFPFWPQSFTRDQHGEDL